MEKEGKIATRFSLPWPPCFYSMESNDSIFLILKRLQQPFRVVFIR